LQEEKGEKTRNTSLVIAGFREEMMNPKLLFMEQKFHRSIARFDHINLLKPTGYVMHNQFNIQQLYALPTLYLCVFYLSENKQRLVPLTA
jgi:hypothetical protein